MGRLILSGWHDKHDKNALLVEQIKRLKVGIGELLAFHSAVHEKADMERIPSDSAAYKVVEDRKPILSNCYNLFRCHVCALYFTSLGDIIILTIGQLHSVVAIEKMSVPPSIMCYWFSLNWVYVACNNFTINK
ncbi:MAG: hypothetical protein WBE68_17055 [Candidatus Nitrosopolaris sp.]